MNHSPALDLHGLTVVYAQPSGSDNLVVRDVSLELVSGEVLGLAGESGCGKTTTAFAAVGYPPPGSRLVAGSSVVAGVDLLAASLDGRRRVWGATVAFVAQNAASALNPSISVGRQLSQILRAHTDLRGDELRTRQIELFTSVGLPSPEAALKKFPFQFSGGQQQRVAIAIAIACRPEVLILDEPTTGLDVTTQAHITQLLRTLVEQEGLAALYVSHDLSLLSSIADRISIMYAGEVVESGATADVIQHPVHPYTKALLAAVPDGRSGEPVVGIPGRPPLGVAASGCGFAPRCPRALEVCRVSPIALTTGEDGHQSRCINPGSETHQITTALRIPAESATPRSELLVVSGVSCHYGTATGPPAVSDVSFSLKEGESIGILGESGSGKSTLLRALGGLHAPTSGLITFRGEPLAGRALDRSREQRRAIQIVFQNPDSSLNPRMTVGQILSRPIKLFRPDVTSGQSDSELLRLLDEVHLPARALHRFPGELSGGQRQRVALARAFAARPLLILADEVTSALDVSVQATILGILRSLASSHNTSLVFVSHDLAVLRDITSRALVMRNSVVCEAGTTSDLFENPKHEYTKTLVAAIPSLHRGT